MRPGIDQGCINLTGFNCHRTGSRELDCHCGSELRGLWMDTLGSALPTASSDLLFPPNGDVHRITEWLNRVMLPKGCQQICVVQQR